MARVPATTNISAAVPEAVLIRLELPEIRMVGFFRTGPRPLKVCSAGGTKPLGLTGTSTTSVLGGAEEGRSSGPPRESLCGVPARAGASG